MMKGHFHNALTNLQSMLGSMAAYAEEAVLLSGKAVEDVSLEKAASVIAGDEKIDAMRMVKQLLIGILIMFVIAMGAPLLIKGLNAWIL